MSRHSRVEQLVLDAFEAAEKAGVVINNINYDDTLPKYVPSLKKVSSKELGEALRSLKEKGDIECPTQGAHGRGDSGPLYRSYRLSQSYKNEKKFR